MTSKNCNPSHFSSDPNPKGISNRFEAAGVMFVRGVVAIPRYAGEGFARGVAITTGDTVGIVFNAVEDFVPATICGVAGFVLGAGAGAAVAIENMVSAPCQLFANRPRRYGYLDSALSVNEND